ncbi:hypothetical protein [Aromatoleum evansii]|uniref:hypothetical protein n=1 Tax=Aromatoleum evansii TaxID=59406 RepID=UPI00145DBE25|nr:hypothetical protein [Aromatoleum evansii]NMG32532.1 hypothetical protein [Aromatoleum evansii]
MAGNAYPPPLDAGVARIVGWLDANRREAFEERAAIMEYDAKLARLEAERLALIQTLSHYGFPVGGAMRVLRTEMDRRAIWVLASDPASACARLRASGYPEPIEEALDVVVRSRFGGLAFLAGAP